MILLYAPDLVPDQHFFHGILSFSNSAMILNQLGIETPQTFKNSAAYIQNWLQVLKNDNKFIVSAASKAEKAVNYIMAEA